MYLFSAIIWIVLLHIFIPIKHIIPFPWNLLGIIPLFAGCHMNIVADKAFKVNNTTVKPFEKPFSLITTGVFRFSRNPMYLGFILILSGLTILLGSLSLYVVIIIFFICMKIIFIRPEETNLETTFGELWLRYKKEVRRWV